MIHGINHCASFVLECRFIYTYVKVIVLSLLQKNAKYFRRLNSLIHTTQNKRKTVFALQDLMGLVQAKTNLKNLFNDLNRFRFLLGVSSTTKPSIQS